ncbi:LodA/GoxA family CTQ-dependent oxidase [Massilia violaceinigra]|uniref:LodA/GoxA family CTQ-dependent oxidase n=1 Tax=Massilia violaceinigra TaxID=2045208 RepID=UPI001ABF6C1C|nr:LodA/GoxA family CTQ-dependent oxidase [Massilia violaceinigra]
MPSPVSYRIHPSIGVGRVGNSLDAYYLAPDSIGGLPIEASASGDPVFENNAPKRVTQFKDAKGRIKRQAATFAIYQSTPDGLGEVELDLTGDLVESVVWSVHVANKKSAWWDFVPLLGDLMFGKYNSYETWQAPPAAWDVGSAAWTGYRNSDTTGDARQALIIDPGPRSVTGALAAPVEFTADTVPEGYTHASFPPTNVSQGLPVKSLGEIRTDSRANLLVLGGFGHAGGNESITGFGGGNTWNDDIADGPVTALITFKDQTQVTLSAWVVIGSPKFAPQLVNVSTWDDVALDCALKYQGARPDVYDLARWADTSGWNPEYKVNYWEDIKPFLNRMADYQWVATVPSMTAFINPPFDPSDASEAARPQREQFLRYFRQPPTRRPALPMARTSNCSAAACRT